MSYKDKINPKEYIFVFLSSHVLLENSYYSIHYQVELESEENSPTFKNKKVLSFQKNKRDLL